MTELRQLTSARGIAAWLVVGYHIRQSIAGLPPPARAVLDKGYLAVDFFFVLSGFVIWLTWHDRLRAGDRATTLRFLQKRVARVWPLHLVVLGVLLAVVIALIATGRDPGVSFATLPLNVLLVQNWGFTRTLGWNDPAWSISCELAAYLLFPLLVAAVDWRRLGSAALVGIAAAVLGALWLVMIRQPGLGADIPRFGLARCLAEFTVGTIVAALYIRGAGKAAGVLAAALVAAWLAGAPETLIVPACFAAGLLALARSTRPLQGRVAHWIGEISYATYLSHFVMWKIFKLAVVADDVAVAPAAVAAYLLLVLAASAILYHGVERPAQRWINALGRRAIAPAPERSGATRISREA